MSDREIKLIELGWDNEWAATLANSCSPAYLKQLYPARVVIAHGGTYVVLSDHGRQRAVLKGVLKREIRSGNSKPVVGDWVLIKKQESPGAVSIDSILPRRNKFSRSKGNTIHSNEQVIAANIDTVFIISSMNAEYNRRRLERYVTQVRVAGAQPVIVLSKQDICSDDEVAEFVIDARSIPNVNISVISSVTHQGIDELQQYFHPNKTVCLIGRSGVGKSTLVNVLFDDELQATELIREDGKGRHTTSYRELLLLPSGGMIIDNPGMREFQLWDVTADDINDTFEDIIEIARGCRFNDCRHLSEPECAVKKAVADGLLDEDRLIAWHRLHSKE